MDSSFSWKVSAKWGQLQRLPQELARLDRFDLLILDDLSYVRRDQAETSVLFELISERYERKSLAITANTPFSQRGEVFVEPAMTLAAVDRLVHHSTILEMNVESYRRRSAHTAQSVGNAPNTPRRKGATGGHPQSQAQAGA